MKPEYWRATGLEDTIYRCFYRKPCKGSQQGPNQTSFGDGLCRKGHKGPLCNVCENNSVHNSTDDAADERHRSWAIDDEPGSPLPSP